VSDVTDLRAPAPPVRAAIRRKQRAEADLERLREAYIAGDTTVTGAAIAEAEHAITMASLDIEAARRILAEEAEAERRALVEAGERRRRKMHEEAERVRLEGEQRAIDSGLAERVYSDLARNGGSPDAQRKLDEIRAQRDWADGPIVVEPQAMQ
jgi:hypothetical protein